MPWETDSHPYQDYKTKTVHLDGNRLPTTDGHSNRIRIGYLRIKNFTSPLKRKKRSFEDFLLFQITNLLHDCSNLDISQQENEEVFQMFNEFSSIIRDDLPVGLPPQHEVDHAIEVDADSKHPHRSTFQLSLDELVATKEYITAFLEKGKTRLGRELSGAPLFFVKNKGSSGK